MMRESSAQQGGESRATEGCGSPDRTEDGPHHCLHPAGRMLLAPGRSAVNTIQRVGEDKCARHLVIGRCSPMKMHCPLSVAQGARRRLPTGCQRLHNVAAALMFASQTIGACALPQIVKAEQVPIASQ
jgi:hypothetical protein